MKNEMIVSSGNTSLTFSPNTLHFSIQAHNTRWHWVKGFQPYLESVSKRFYFSEASDIRHQVFTTGVGQGILSYYTGFKEKDGSPSPLRLETYVWIEKITGDVLWELHPYGEPATQVLEVYWPGVMEFDENSSKAYSVLNTYQGLITPNDWKYEISKENNPLVFQGQLCTTAAYMPWWGQIKPDGGYMAICQTPWDAAYGVEHPAGGPYTHIQPRWLESLGNISYRRSYRYKFFGSCDYNDLCKAYRWYSKETGLFVSLEEKAVKCPSVDDLIGSAIVHKGIKSHFEYYDPSWGGSGEDTLVPFSVRKDQMKKIHEMGVEKAYLHLDGWGQPGYDNQHPDYLPAVKEAGGWSAMKDLADTLQDVGYLFGIHDQYRDYYFNAETFDDYFAAWALDETYVDQTRWAGGRQTFLCATQAPLYLKRNFEQIFKEGITLDAAYLDVFTCNEPDQCAHPAHTMTRKECLEFRSACFYYLLSRGILSSSEEIIDWAIPSLVFCHYAPYEFMLQRPDREPKGIPTPLFNLVYHDCVIIPWTMDKDNEKDYMLYALLNGGAAYLDVESENLEEEIARWKIVSQLQEKVAKSEMVEHKFLTEDYSKEQATYCNGTVVTIDHKDFSWEISSVKQSP